MRGINGKTAFVTGAEKGLGKEVAKTFVEEGANVVLFGIDETAGKETEAEIKQAGGKVLFIQGNVASSDDLKAAVEKTVETFGDLDFGVNCAGIANALTRFDEFSEEDFDKIMGVNLKGIFLSMKHQLSVMSKKGKGKIVNITSGVGQVGGKGISVYSGSKHGVNGLTKSAALDFAHTDIRINAVSPGTMGTPMVLVLPEEDKEHYKAACPIHELIDVKSVAENAVWLCSEASKHMTGTILNVDGGYLAQ